MAYHLYDNAHRHLAMADSLEDLQAAALDLFQQDEIPYGYIRWTDARGEKKELQVSPDSLYAARAQLPDGNYRVQVQVPLRDTPQRTAERRAAWITNGLIVAILMYMANEIASIVLQQG